MLSRTGRLACGLLIAQAAFIAVAPKEVEAASPFECNDPGHHYCCIEDENCPDTHTYCCEFEAPNPTPIDCKCASPS